MVLDVRIVIIPGEEGRCSDWQEAQEHFWDAVNILFLYLSGSYTDVFTCVIIYKLHNYDLCAFLYVFLYAFLL